MAVPCEFIPHIVQRFNGFNRVLDTCAGIGTVSIALAQAGHEIIGVEVDEGRLKQAREKAEQSGVTIEWIKGDILNHDVLQRIEGIDAAFLDPDWKRDYSTDPRTVTFSKMEPPLMELLSSIREKTENMALRLPKETDFTKFHHLIGSNYYYEIEKNFLDDQLKFYVVYFGELARHSEYRV